jgi:uncharacterized membrane protein YhhN
MPTSTAHWKSRNWNLLIGASGAVAIAAYYLDGAMALHWLCKPLTTLLIAAMTVSLPSADVRYRRWVVIGLLWSTLGDIFLMLPGDYFAPGLASFLVAHCAYLVAFSRRTRFLAKLWPFLVYALVATAVLASIWVGVPPSLKGPVLVYVAALAAMAAQAMVMWHCRSDRASAYAAAGGGCFLLSDGILAWNRFGTPFDAARLVVLVCYWIAQWLIARSVANTERA